LSAHSSTGSTAVQRCTASTAAVSIPVVALQPARRAAAAAAAAGIVAAAAIVSV
jgi:hypothetical protein